MCHEILVQNLQQICIFLQVKGQWARVWTAALTGVSCHSCPTPRTIWYITAMLKKHDINAFYSTEIPRLVTGKKKKKKKKKNKVCPNVKVCPNAESAAKQKKTKTTKKPKTQNKTKTKKKTPTSPVAPSVFLKVPLDPAGGFHPL